MNFAITSEKVKHPYPDEFCIIRTRVELWYDNYPVPVGTMWLMPFPYAENEVWIDWLEVISLYRRQGIATLLVKWAADKYNHVHMDGATDEGEAFEAAVAPAMRST